MTTSEIFVLFTLFAVVYFVLRFFVKLFRYLKVKYQKAKKRRRITHKKWRTNGEYWNADKKRWEKPDYK